MIQRRIWSHTVKSVSNPERSSRLRQSNESVTHRIAGSITICRLFNYKYNKQRTFLFRGSMCGTSLSQMWRSLRISNPPSAYEWLATTFVSQDLQIFLLCIELFSFGKEALMVGVLVFICIDDVILPYPLNDITCFPQIFLLHLANKDLLNQVTTS